MVYFRRAMTLVTSIVLAMAMLSACSLDDGDDTPADEESAPTETVISDAEETTDEENESPEEEDENSEPDQPAFEGEPEVESMDSDIEVEVMSDDYEPASDVLIGTHGDEEIAPKLYLISPDGEVQEAWQITNRPGAHMLDRRVLDSGNIMFIIQHDGAYEMTPEGEIVWSFKDPGITHHAEMLPNGNVLITGAVCDCVLEVDYKSTDVVWSWDAHQAFPEYDESDEAFHRGDEFDMVNIFADAADGEGTWSHTNYAQVLENDNVIISLRNFDTVLEVNRDGETVWSFGPGVIKHQHTPVDLGDGTMLIYDNGNHRAIRIDRGTGEILWSYDDLDSAIMGDVNLLEDGNYKVVDSLPLAVNVVSPDEELLWQLSIETEEDVNGVYRAHFPDLED